MSMKLRLSQSWQCWRFITQFCIHVKDVATTKEKLTQIDSKRNINESQGCQGQCSILGLTQERRRQDDQAGIPSCWSHEINGWTFHWRQNSSQAAPRFLSNPKWFRYFSSSSRRFNIPESPRKTLGVSGSKHHKRCPNLGQRQRNAFGKGMRLSTKAAARAQQVPCKATLVKPREASRSSKFHYFSCRPLLAELQCIDDIKTKRGSKTQWGLGSVEPWSHQSKNELFWATVIKSNALEAQTKK